MTRRAERGELLAVVAAPTSRWGKNNAKNDGTLWPLLLPLPMRHHVDAPVPIILLGFIILCSLLVEIL